MTSPDDPDHGQAVRAGPAHSGPAATPLANSGAAEPARQYRVTVQFFADGPAVTGYWTNPTTAEGKFHAWIASHGNVGSGVHVTLWQDTPAGLQEMRAWTRDDGEVARPGVT
jgi:hypothetical protein